MHHRLKDKNIWSTDANQVAVCKNLMSHSQIPTEQIEFYETIEIFWQKKRWALYLQGVREQVIAQKVVLGQI